MKLAAIYNVWDGVELLRGSMLCLKDHVDLFIIVYQDVSNYGEKYDPIPEIDFTGIKSHILVKYSPECINGYTNEKKKRNIGLDYAYKNDCTHFLHMDCDEYYEDFGKAKQEFIDSGHNGSVCKMHTYFKKPTLRFENLDNYYVPFIHKLKSISMSGVNSYPFYVDPTRSINESDVVELQTKMHHFSWVRKDINRKIRNSSANLARSPKLLEDYNSDNTKDGYYVEGFHQKLISVDNNFNINI